MAGLVVRNTFLDFPDHREAGFEDEAHHARPRAVSDLTDTKLPWKVPLSDQAEGLYQVTRRRLGSNNAESPACGDGEGLHTVEEEEDPASMARKGSRSSRAGGGNGSNRRSRLETAEMSPGVMPGMPPMPSFFPGHMPMGHPAAMPMMSGYGPGAFPYAGMMASPWGQFPGMFPPYLMPGTAPAPSPGIMLQQGGGSMPAGKSAGKGKQQRRDQPLGGGPNDKGGAQQRKGGKGQGEGGRAPHADVGGRQHDGRAAMGGRDDGGAAYDGRGQQRASMNAPPPAQPPGEPTTVMLRNIPNRYTSGSLLALLDEHGFQALYDFVYLPMDFQNGVNLGYAFVNLLRHEDAIRFKDVFQGFQAWRFDSAKVSEVSWAHPHQGLEEHVERYRNSPVMHPSMPDEYKPMIFNKGVRVTFPPPTRVIKAPKLRVGRDRPREPGREEAPREAPGFVAAVA